MEHTKREESSTEFVNILLVGNNPIEMGKVLDLMKNLPGRNVMTEIAFDVKSILERLIKFRPNYILIDDNIGKTVLNQTVQELTHNRRTKHIPVTVLKNSNYTESVASANVMDYLLKQNLTSEGLYRMLQNNFKFRRTQELIRKAYSKRKKQLKEFLKEFN